MDRAPGTDAAEGEQSRPARMRCSNSDRERAEQIVQRALGEGRLTMDEAGTRVGRVYEAKYVDELAELVVDLPEAPGDHRGAGGWRGVGESLRHQLRTEADVLFGRAPARRGRRLAAAAIVLLPIMIMLAVVAFLVLHGLVDGREVGDGDGYATRPELGELR